jgi:two-component sensor histidine kinase
VECLSWWMERLGRLQAVHVPRVADLPPTGAVRQILEQQEVRSIVVVPMVYSQSMVGMVGFDAVQTEKAWPQDVIALLKIVGEIFVNALERVRIEAIRTRAEEQILAALQEKEVLLQEIHHRVKNNLQVVSSLLNLQSRYIEDEKTLQMFRESQSRVKSMALIHERLYRSKDLAQIDFGEYVQTLTRDLFRSYQAQAGSVALKVDVQDVFLGVDTAIPCGLIINELVSNALKYAFPDDRDGQLCVELASDDGQYVLAVRDNGVGLPDGLDIQSTETLGLRLVTTLVRQLRGTVELRSDGGTEFEIRFDRPARG